MKWFDPTGATRPGPADPRRTGAEAADGKSVQISLPPPLFRWLSRPICSAWGYLPGLLGLTHGAHGMMGKPAPPPEDFRP
ncbi:hypothetical protein OKA04_11040 [Luteolibacter flavescens]|uniref:Uncharacterized protein n=1 Tax=Luteolibacter flavescens TaxID=1859460 RepID=A0ABT3FQM7_9BACT|nr:hypothetical protein [Luteolibacter flavescens]MCW1885265.1 hypothetical protein [Luteolibacter flavescens]